MGTITDTASVRKVGAEAFQVAGDKVRRYEVQIVSSGPAVLLFKGESTLSLRSYGGIPLPCST